MKKPDLIGLSPLWLLGLALALCFLLIVGVPMLTGPIDAKTWFGFAGSLISGGCAIIAVIVATHNVNRQLRINLIGREEERIERELPRLREASEFFHLLNVSLQAGDSKKSWKVLADDYGATLGEALKQFVRRQLPLSDDETRAFAEFAIEEAYEQLGLINSAEFEIRMLDARIDLVESDDPRGRAVALRLEMSEHAGKLADAQRYLDSLKNDILARALAADAKHDVFAKRLIGFRRTIEAHFDT